MDIRKSLNTVCQLVVRHLLTIVCQLAWAYVVYAICRLAFWAENAASLGGWETLTSTSAWWGGLIFDTSAILYTNVLWILCLIALPVRQCKMRRVLFVVVNTLAVAINCCDAVYFPFTSRRTTYSVFEEFSAEGNLGRIFLTECVNHWYLVVLTAGIAALLWWTYNEWGKKYECALPKVRYVAGLTTLLLLAYPFICGIRGGHGKYVRPITLSNAVQYVERPSQVAFVLNTPFTLLRTIGRSPFQDPQYFSPQECESIYNPVLSVASDSTDMKRMNVLVFILESFGREYFGIYNHGKGFTPFLDSICSHALHYENAFGNGRKSIDGMPSILSSIPMFKQPVFVSPYSVNEFTGLARELSREGYSTTFYHGAPNGSMGFEAFAYATGFKRYVGMTEYVEATGRSEDFDGVWALWDEEFLQFMARDIQTDQKPFMSAVFTASSHHPYQIPKRYADIYPEGEKPIHKCISYCDHALRLFFERVKDEPWFRNTLFVFTADHTNQMLDPYYTTELGIMRVPIIFYAPGDSTLSGMHTEVAQQIDIMPTVLSYLGYKRPFVAFGKDLLHTTRQEAWAAHEIQGTNQYVTDSLLVQFDGQRLKAAYAWRTDSLLRHNILGTHPQAEQESERRIKALLQQYMVRMINNKVADPQLSINQ